MLSFGKLHYTIPRAVFSPDGKLVATGSHKDSIKIWNVADATELFPQPADESSSDASKESGKGED